jgi:hypothetical protein
MARPLSQAAGGFTSQLGYPATPSPPVRVREGEPSSPSTLPKSRAQCKFCV